MSGISPSSGIEEANCQRLVPLGHHGQPPVPARDAQEIRNDEKQGAAPDHPQRRIQEGGQVCPRRAGRVRLLLQLLDEAQDMRPPGSSPG